MVISLIQLAYMLMKHSIQYEYFLENTSFGDIGVHGTIS